MPHADPARRAEYVKAYRARTRERRNEGMRAWKAANPDKVREYARKAYANNPAKHKAKHAAYVAKAKPWLRESNKQKQREYLYGMSPGTYAEMLAAQSNCCAGCGTSISTSGCVDHCHAENRIRGLLCRKCNLALGHTNDDPEILRRLASYLEK